MVHSSRRRLSSSFYMRVYQIVDDPSSDSIISWSESNNSFIIWNVEELVRKILPTYAKFGNNFLRFHSTLRSYGFIRVKVTPGQLEFAHEDFFRYQPELLKMMMANSKRAQKSKAKKARVQVERLLQHLRI